MWKYYLDESRIDGAISTRAQLNKSVMATDELLSSLGYGNEKVKLIHFDDLIFTSGSMDETYSSDEISFCENVGNIFVSINHDIFDFFIIDIDEKNMFDAYYIGKITKIINKAFKGRNVIIFQAGEYLMFSSRYVSKVWGRDFHFTYWMSDTSKIKMFSAYNLCIKDMNHSYALYLAMVFQNSIFKHRKWTDRDEDEVLDVNFVVLSRDLSYISSRQVDSFDLLDKAFKTTDFIKNDAKMSEYSADYIDDSDELQNDEEDELIFNLLKV